MEYISAFLEPIDCVVLCSLSIGSMCDTSRILKQYPHLRERIESISRIKELARQQNLTQVLRFALTIFPPHWFTLCQLISVSETFLMSFVTEDLLRQMLETKYIPTIFLIRYQTLIMKILNRYPRPNKIQVHIGCFDELIPSKYLYALNPSYHATDFFSLKDIFAFINNHVGLDLNYQRFANIISDHLREQKVLPDCLFDMESSPIMQNFISKLSNSEIFISTQCETLACVSDNLQARLICSISRFECPTNLFVLLRYCLDNEAFVELMMRSANLITDTYEWREYLCKIYIDPKSVEVVDTFGHRLSNRMFCFWTSKQIWKTIHDLSLPWDPTWEFCKLSPDLIADMGDKSESFDPYD